MHRVRKRLDGAVYAVKRTRHPLISDAEQQAALREVYALAALVDCPKLSRYFDAWYDSEQRIPHQPQARPTAPPLPPPLPPTTAPNVLPYFPERPDVPTSQRRRNSPTPQRPNVTRCEDDHLFIQVEFLAGGSLEQLARAKCAAGIPLDEAAVLRAMRDAAEALAFMHARRIAHLDVKPANIIAVGVDGVGGFKLGDLGNATALDATEMPIHDGDQVAHAPDGPQFSVLSTAAATAAS